jgi:transcriptional regulator with XRE-family HTH domain
MQRVAQYNVTQMQHDMAAKGWMPIDLARKARVDKATVSRFFDGSFQTARTAKKLATALGYSVRRYLRPLELSA